ncbi:alpha/beta hydrolase family protein [Marinobacter bryozoorum]|uniref:DUF3530 family protein n=1 Tax=Marinobacter bryozoorum TaxID=256324 RepID=UPI00200639BA|nr:DUF3530 family protein [Marinobacter bryozoorum]MCK7542722.1 alpha/beta hydrolase family protein [Marinobacter bryozoorum]
MHNLDITRWLAVVMTLVLVLINPATAQDAAPGGDAGAAGQDAGDGESKEGSGKPSVERYFIRSAGDSGMLAQRYPHLAVWLEPDGAPRALALVEREVTEAAKGAVVLLADEGQTANHALLAGLRSRLTEAGWAALSLGNSQVSPGLQLARQRAGEAGSRSGQDSSDEGEPVMIDVNDQAAEDLLKAHRDEVNARLDAAVAWLQERDYSQVVLVGVGRGALAVNGYLPRAPAAVSRVAWIAPDFGSQAPGELVSALEGKVVRLLDMYPSRSSAGPGRRAAFRRAGMNGYEALPVPLAGGESGRHAAAIASRLAGWAGGD